MQQGRLRTMLHQVRPWWPRLAAALLALGMLAFAAGPSQAQPAGAIGEVADVVGRALVTRHGDAEPERLTEGQPVLEGDRIRTEAGARVRLRLEDGSILQLGESTECYLDWVLFAPVLEMRDILIEVPLGIIRSIVEAVVPRSSVRLTTDTAIASVRGTDWIVEAGPAITAIVALEGTVAVRNVAPGVTGEVTLGPGEGTSVAAGEPPNPPSVWGDERRQSFIDRTAVPER